MYAPLDVNGIKQVTDEKLSDCFLEVDRCVGRFTVMDVTKIHLNVIFRNTMIHGIRHNAVWISKCTCMELQTHACVCYEWNTAHIRVA